LNAELIKRLMALRPSRRFYLCGASAEEYEVADPKHWRSWTRRTCVWAEDGTTDFLDLKLIERVRMDDDFGPAELEQIWR
jgi:hypothetical protein